MIDHRGAGRGRKEIPGLATGCAMAGLAIVLGLAGTARAHEGSALPDELAGHYVGVRVEATAGGVTPTPADIHLDVRQGDRGFVLRWQSLRELETGVKHHYEVLFRATRRPGIYLAGMRCDPFGHPRPLDPGQGEPYIWAHVEPDGLGLYAMSIADDGSHDLSIYRFRLAQDPPTLSFRRSRDDRPVQRVEAVLERAPAQARAAGEEEDGGVYRHRAPRCG